MLSRVFKSPLTKWIVLQAGLRDTEEQSNGVIIAGHDLAIRLLNAHCRFLLCRFPVRTLDVS
jgi:hypothetical protein